VNVLITGAAGFLGSHLSDALLERGDDVIGLDNYFSGSKENIRHLLGHDHFEMIRHDIVLPIYLEADRIFHLACPASPIHYQYNAIKTIKTAVIGTLNVLGIAKRVRARILYASTSEVYGDPQIHPQPENYPGHVNPIGSRSCYDEGKRVGESLMMNYHRQNGVDIRIARVFNTYGPRMALNDGRVVSSFIVQALKNEDIRVFGDGSQTRSFCYVTDFIRGITALMERENFTGPVNLGNPEEIRIVDLARMIRDLAGSGSKIVFNDRVPDDPIRRQPDISLARRELNWEPSVSLEEGLTQTIAYFTKILKL
jgi:UDP-glucuronate decarboxylase